MAKAKRQVGAPRSGGRRTRSSERGRRYDASIRTLVRTGQAPQATSP
jgi:hypothetical protein